MDSSARASVLQPYTRMGYKFISCNSPYSDTNPRLATAKVSAPPPPEKNLLPTPSHAIPGTQPFFSTMWMMYETSVSSEMELLWLCSKR